MASKEPASKAPAKKAKPKPNRTKPKRPVPALKSTRRKLCSILAVQPPADDDAPAPTQASATGTEGSVLPPLATTEAMFVREYLIDRSGTRAYMRVKPGCKPTSASAEATKLLRRPAVIAAVEAGLARQASRADMKADEVVRRLCGMASADERELMELRVGCCRCCWGVDNRYQRTRGELERAMAEHSAALDAGKPVDSFDPMGGDGYNANHAPNPDCGECFGDGQVRPVFKDTRYLSEGAAMLFAGIKVTKDGMEVKTHSRADALMAMGRHHSLFTDKVKAEVTVDVIGELQAHLGARQSRLPVNTGGDDGKD